jgi:hypothetical protein
VEENSRQDSVRTAVHLGRWTASIVWDRFRCQDGPPVAPAAGDEAPRRETQWSGHGGAGGARTATVSSMLFTSSHKTYGDARADFGSFSVANT